MFSQSLVFLFIGRNTAPVWSSAERALDNEVKFAFGLCREVNGDIRILCFLESGFSFFVCCNSDATSIVRVETIESIGIENLMNDKDSSVLSSSDSIADTRVQ